METLPSTIDAKQIGTRIREAREKAGLNRPQLGEASGIPWRTIERFEYGSQEPSVTRLLSICEALAVPMAELLSNEELENSSAHVGFSESQTLSTEPLPTRIFATQTPMDRVEAILAMIDEMRSDNFDGVIRQPIALAEEATRQLAALEIDELLALARNRGLADKGISTSRELLNEFHNNPNQTSESIRELEERIVDAAVVGVDLYSIELSILHKVADSFAENGFIEGRGLFEDWGKHRVLVPMLRSTFRWLAVLDGSPNFTPEFVEGTA